jgi:hypothetical protein
MKFDLYLMDKASAGRLRTAEGVLRGWPGELPTRLPIHASFTVGGAICGYAVIAMAAGGRHDCTQLRGW